MVPWFAYCTWLLGFSTSCTQRNVVLAGAVDDVTVMTVPFFTPELGDADEANGVTADADAAKPTAAAMSSAAHVPIVNRTERIISVAPPGPGGATPIDACWAATLAGRSGVRSRFDDSPRIENR